MYLADGTSHSGDLIIGADGEHVSTELLLCRDFKLRQLIATVHSKVCVQGPRHITQSSVQDISMSSSYRTLARQIESRYASTDERDVFDVCQRQEDYVLVRGPGVSSSNA